jgi:hypothetical protein
MSDEPLSGPTYQQRLAARLQRENAELDDAVVKAQLQLDRAWQAQRDFERELNDEYMVGGFLERHSATPSFHKSRRDRDWRVR